MKALLVGALLVFGGPWLAPHDPARMVAQPWQPPGPAFWLGTDMLGRDVFSRTLHGGGTLLFIALLGTLLASLTGLIIALLLLMLPDRGRYLVSLFDALLVMPPLLVMIVLLYVVGAGNTAVLLAIVVINAPFTARYLRAMADPMLDCGYMAVARAAGDSHFRLLWRELLPGLYAALCADGGTRLVSSIYLYSAVSFLGVATQGQGSDWASMVRDGLPGLARNPWAALLPATCISGSVVWINLLADRWRPR